MQSIRQRNPYLKRILSDTPHKHSYDIESGKHYLLSTDGKQKQINKIGTFKPKFRRDFTGFKNHQQRYIQSKTDSTCLHFVPDLSYNKKKSYYYPMTQKFAGYAQYPYKMGPFPQHLQNPGPFPKHLLRKSHSQHQSKEYHLHPITQQKKFSKSIILQNSATVFKQADDKFFETSFCNMTLTRPLPKKAKKTCYNYKCKNLQHFTFNQKEKTDLSTRFATKSTFGNTLGRSFHEKRLDIQVQQASLIQNMS